MSCIIGFSGDVDPLVKTATSGRPMFVIDGCPIECARKSLEQPEITPDRHTNLAKRGVVKEYHSDYDDYQADTVFENLVEEGERTGAPA